MNKWFGVNVAGAEFGSDINGGGNLPGVAGVDYIYSQQLSEYQYYAGKGLKLFRIPVRWERIQRVALGDLFYADIQSLKAMLDNVEQVGGKAIIELHNYGRYFGQALTKADAPKFADIWTKLATTFKDHPALYGYELMNEPHDLPEGSDGWAYLVDQAVTAIRTVDAKNYILVPGYDWQSADRWVTSNTANIENLGDKIIYSAHCYFDNDASGQYTSGAATDPQVGVTRVKHFTDWLEANNYQGIITEFGIPWNDASWLPVLDNFMQELESNPNIVGATVWAGGPWWGDYILTVEPKDGQDRPQMSILAKYPTVIDTQPTTTQPTPTPAVPQTPATPPVAEPQTQPTPTPQTIPAPDPRPIKPLPQDPISVEKPTATPSTPAPVPQVTTVEKLIFSPGEAIIISLLCVILGLFSGALSMWIALH